MRDHLSIFDQDSAIEKSERKILNPFLISDCGCLRAEPPLRSIHQVLGNFCIYKKKEMLTRLLLQDIGRLIAYLM